MPFFWGSLLGVKVKLCSESELCTMKLPSGFAQQSTGESNGVAFQKLRQQQILQLDTERHSSFERAPAPKPALMIHISWIKHRQQRLQQVSWTVCIRKTLYLRKLQHIPCSQPAGSSSVCWEVRVGCWQPNSGPTIWIERWFSAIIEIGL